MKRMILAVAIMMAVGTGTQVNAANVDTIQSIQEFNSYVQKNPLVVVMAGSHSCPHCTKMLPVFQSVAQEMGNARFVFVDATNSSFSDRLGGIRSMPTFKVFKNGQIVGGTTGEQTREQLRALVSR